uniref:Uncharacterized protein n=1 Tax=Compsopogon caeruleus TaxID=31354 RepID=A0A7S1XEZ0_9RHOD
MGGELEDEHGKWVRVGPMETGGPNRGEVNWGSVRTGSGLAGGGPDGGKIMPIADADWASARGSKATMSQPDSGDLVIRDPDKEGWQNARAGKIQSVAEDVTPARTDADWGDLRKQQPVEDTREAVRQPVRDPSNEDWSKMRRAGRPMSMEPEKEITRTDPDAEDWKNARKGPPQVSMPDQSRPTPDWSSARKGAPAQAAPMGDSGRAAGNEDWSKVRQRHAPPTQSSTRNQRDLNWSATRGSPSGERPQKSQASEGVTEAPTQDMSEVGELQAGGTTDLEVPVQTV